MKQREVFQPDRLTGPMPPLEIIELLPVPRLQLVVELRINSGIDPARGAAFAVEFTSKVLAADRKLRLTVETGSSPAELWFVFRPSKLGADLPGRLKALVETVKTLVAQFDGAELLRADVVPQA